MAHFKVIATLTCSLELIVERVSAYWNVEAPEKRALDWFAEFQVKLMFPK